MQLLFTFDWVHSVHGLRPALVELIPKERQEVDKELCCKKNKKLKTEMKQFYLTLTLKNVLSEENPVNLCPLYTSDLVTGPRSQVPHSRYSPV